MYRLMKGALSIHVMLYICTRCTSMMWAVYEKVDGFAAVRVLGAGLP